VCVLVFCEGRTGKFYLTLVGEYSVKVPIDFTNIARKKGYYLYLI